MRIIKPVTLTDAMLTSTNVLDVAPDLYAGGTTYDTGDFIHIVNGLALDIYESLQDANTGNDPATETDWWVYRSSTYPEYSPGTTYSAGDIVIIDSVHKKFESLQDSNTGNAPDTSNLWWIELGSTNVWTAFDKKIGSRTIRTGSIEYTITPGMIVEKLSFLNMACSSISVSVVDPVEGTVLEQEINMISTSNVFDGYLYCFAPFLFIRNTVTLDIPPYKNAVITVVISGGSDINTVGAGTIVFGRVSYIGGSRYSPTYDFIDYTIKKPDDYGNVDVTERPFSKRIQVDMIIKNSMLGFVTEEIETYRATAVVWIMTERSESLQNVYLIYGFVKSFNTVADYLTHSFATIEIESLI